MEESKKTYIPGVRTSPVSYEMHTSSKRPEEERIIYQPVCQGNKKYSVSPIYCKKEDIRAKDSELKQERPTLRLRKKRLNSVFLNFNITNTSSFIFLTNII